MNSGAARCWLLGAQRERKEAAFVDARWKFAPQREGEKYWMQNECFEADELGMEGGKEGGNEFMR